MYINVKKKKFFNFKFPLEYAFNIGSPILKKY